MITFTNNPILTPLLAGDHRASSKIVKEMIAASVPVNEIYEDLLKPALYKIGELWEQNKINVATEHLATAIVESLLYEINLSLNIASKTGKSAIVTCIENEHHRIGARMVSDIFEMNGWNVFYLGANTPTKDFLEYTQLMNPDILCISLSIYYHLPTLQSTLEDIRNQFPELPVLIGGQAFNRGGREIISDFKNIYYLPDITSINNYLKSAFQ